MLGDAPFPDASSDSGHDGAGTSEPMLRKQEWQRFGDTGVYRDTPFAVVFVVQLASVLAIAIANGIGVSSQPTAPSSDPQHLMRARQMILILGVTAVTAALLSCLWLVLLRSGARQVLWLPLGRGASTRDWLVVAHAHASD
jgi:hypothetical protein